MVLRGRLVLQCLFKFLLYYIYVIKEGLNDDMDEKSLKIRTRDYGQQKKEFKFVVKVGINIFLLVKTVTQTLTLCRAKRIYLRISLVVICKTKFYIEQIYPIF